MLDLGGPPAPDAPTAPGSAKDGAVPDSIAASVGRNAAAETPSDPPRRGRGRPPGSKNKPKDGAAPAPDAASAPQKVNLAVVVPAATIGKVAGGAFSALGGWAARYVAGAMREAGAPPAEIVSTGRKVADLWTLTPEEAEAIGKAAQDWFATLNVELTPGVVFVIALATPLVGRGIATYGLVRGQNGAGARGGADGLRKVASPEGDAPKS